METSFFRMSFIFVHLFATLLFLSGCKKESNPVTPPSEHSEPEGWVIRDGTTRQILVVWQGIIQTEWDGLSLSDTLYAPLNALSDHLSIKFLNSEKKIFNPPASSDYSLGWKITDTSILAIIQDSPSDYAIHLKGKKEGKTSLELQLRHLGHTDARTPLIPVIVRIDTSAFGEPIGVRLSYENDGMVLANATASTTSGKLEIRKDSTSRHIKVEFVDDNGKYFQPEYPLHSLSFHISPSGIFQAIPESGEPWVFSIKGLIQGNASLVIKLNVSGIAEFTSAPIPVSVLP